MSTIIIVVVVAVIATVAWLGIRSWRRRAVVRCRPPQIKAAVSASSPEPPRPNAFVQLNEALGQLKQAAEALGQAAETMKQTRAAQERTNAGLHRIQETLPGIRENLRRQREALEQVARRSPTPPAKMVDSSPRPVEKPVQIDPAGEVAWRRFIEQPAETDPTKIN